ncbi:MAG: hypothetical protein IPK16_11200 [Anaerolineales bacterium]|nr:hypothetical protein [Anaerolineales bacterium]
MSGLVGYVSVGEISPDDGLLSSMIQAVKNESWYCVDEYRDAHAALARVSLGLTNPAAQPIWNRGHSACILMEGELYAAEQLKQELIDRGHHFRVNNDAELILYLFEEFGEACAERLNGAFHVAIWEPAEQRLTIFNDRFGLYPLYYIEQGQRLLFGAGVRAILADPTAPRRPNRLAMAEMLSFEHLIGEHTLAENVRVAPAAAWMVYKQGRLTVKTYWDIAHPRLQKLYTDAEYRDQLSHLLQQAVTRQFQGDLPTGILLSGGLDSRLVLGLLRMSAPTADLRSFTFGIPDCDDARFAAEVASIVHSQHQFMELKPDFVQEIAAEGVRLTDGMKSCIHMHVFANLRAQARSVRVIYKGYMGDPLMGSHLKRSFWGEYERPAIDDMTFAQYNSLIKQSDHAQVFTEPMRQFLQHGVREHFVQEFAQYETTVLGNWEDHFDFRQRQRRFILNGVELVRSQVLVRTPFCDNELVEFMLSVPPGLRYERALCIMAFIEMLPALAKVPWTRTNLPLVPTMRMAFSQLNQQARWMMRNHGLHNIPVTQPRQYADYALWLRTACKAWVESTLLNKHALERGYFKPEYVRNLVSEHMAGADHSRALGVLLAIELWHQQFMD